MAGITRQQREVSAESLKQVKFRLDEDRYNSIKAYATDQKLSLQMLFEQFVEEKLKEKSEIEISQA